MVVKPLGLKLFEIVTKQSKIIYNMTKKPDYGHSSMNNESTFNSFSITLH